jgi:rhodanese-related sulfurtransferase
MFADFTVYSNLTFQQCKHINYKQNFTEETMKTGSIFAMLAVLTMTLGGCASTHGTSPKGLEVPIEKAAVKFSSDMKDGGYKIVGTDELKKWLDEGKKLTIISTLPVAEDKEFGILPNAVNGAMPKSEKELTPADKDGLLKVAGIDKERQIVVYCGFVACRRSHIGAKILVDNGFSNVYRYPAGVTGWGESGYPLTK